MIILHLYSKLVKVNNLLINLIQITDYLNVMGGTELPDSLKSCGEQLLNDLWKYSMILKQWLPIKLDYN